jgi:AraC family transcriptional regulator, transcriptional activator of pobA
MYINLDQVPFYGLYGEPLKNVHPDVVHIEEIADRSRDYGWIIESHRHSKLFQVIYLRKGEVDLLLDGMDQHLVGSWVISIPMGVVHGFKFEPNSQGFVLSIDQTVLMALLKIHQDAAFHNLVYSPQVIQCLDDHKSLGQFLQYILLLHEEFNHYQVKRQDALEGLARLTLLSLMRHLHQMKMVHQEGSVDSQLLGKFWVCLELHYREHWTLERYAEHLHISTSTLSRLCQKYVGESPKTILQERLLVEAKRKLIFTRQTMEEIAFSLGFKDQAYFSRFIKSHLDMTPGVYRKTFS